MITVLLSKTIEYEEQYDDDEHAYEILYQRIADYLGYGFNKQRLTKWKFLYHLKN